MAQEPEPELKPPPWIHTMTGIFSPPFRIFVHTFRYRQSSLITLDGIRNSAVYLSNGTGSRCMAFARNVSHLRTPPQVRTGSGALHRKGPTGGAAKGMPLKI